MFPVTPLLAQSASIPIEKAIALAETSHCKEAIPSLKRASSSANTFSETRKQAEVLGLRCALNLDDRDSVNVFLQQLHQQFSQDPDVLFIVVHAYSDLSTG